MKIRLLRISNFRGFEQTELKPRGHVLLVGEPGAGRSDIVEALCRVLSPDSSRFPSSDDLDFFNRDLSKRIEIEIVLGDLGTQIEQAFLDRLEMWDLDVGQLLEELSHESDRNENRFEYVIRLCYRAIWDPDRQHAEQWVDFPKFSDPETEDFRYVPRNLREQLPVAFINNSSETPLSLGARGDLRRMIDARANSDFPATLENLMKEVAQLAGSLVESKDLVEVLERILSPLRVPLNLGERPASEIIRFVPEGGSVGGVLRGLQPTMKLRESLGFLPLPRHGSTLAALLRLTQAVAQRNNGNPVIIVDDFGEDVDLDAALHVGSMLRMCSGQLWLSTRRGALGQCFGPEELVRLTNSRDAVRRIHVGQVPTTRAERLAARHLHLQILPAISSRAIIIVEGPHDRAALTTAAAKLNVEEGTPLPAAYRIVLLDAGAADSSGGNTAIPRLATLARNLGFHVTALIDWDQDAKVAEDLLKRNIETSNVVIRWPQGCAIERALLTGLEEDIIRLALKEISDALAVPLEFNPDKLSNADLIGRATVFLKSAGGMHTAFLEALPEKCLPPLIRTCLELMPRIVDQTGVVLQL